MMNRCGVAVLLLSAAFCFAQCSDDKSTQPEVLNPGDTSPAIIDISGITQTAFDGGIASTDADD